MPAPPYQRLVLAVAHGQAGPALLARAAEAARLLRLALHCVLIEDEALARLAALPFVRELRLPTHDWQPLDPARLAAEQSAAEAALRRTLEGLGARLGIAQGLEVQRGDVELCFGGLCVAGDIVVLADATPPPHLAGRLRQLARQSPAAILLLPAMQRPPAAEPGVAALVAGPGDPALDVAERIAAASGGRLKVATAPEEAATAGEGLLVMSDQAGWEQGLAEALARSRRVAVLVV